jgi:hypothetical protein
MLVVAPFEVLGRTWTRRVRFATMSAKDDQHEREDLLEALNAHRNFLRMTVRGITDEQAHGSNRAVAGQRGGS